MKIVDLMINLLDGLYDLNDKTKTQLRCNADEIERAFEGYQWEDIKRAINFYYVRKNDKTRPTIAKILAILDTDPQTQKFTPVDYQEVKRPTTKIFEIKVTFDRLVNALSGCGLLNHEPITPTLSIIRNDGTVVLDAKNQLQYEVEQAKRKNVELFQRYGALTWLEALAICIDNDLMHIKFRHNKKFFDSLPDEARRYIRNRQELNLVNFLRDWKGRTTAGVYTL